MAMADALPDIIPLQRRRRLPSWLGQPMVAVSLLVAALAVACALAPEWIAPHDPYAQGLIRRLKGPLFEARNGDLYLLGTDQLGRDILSRIIHGTRITLLISLAAVVVGASIGILAGLVAGYAGGVTDAVTLRLIDIQLAFPVILLVIAVAGAVGPSLPALVLVMGLSSWPSYARIIRASVLSLRDAGFVEAARAMGTTTPHIILRHIAPNVLSAAIVFATFELSRMILIEATLSFLGLGVQPPTPTWGGMISEGQKYLAQSWAASVFPGVAIALAILAINQLGDLTRDRLDPQVAHDS
jgi:peptide/nickel transport system permease protein